MNNGVPQYVNREISWLSFNERVLQEAADTDNPIIERMKFLGIFSSNLDEFFRVRVATVTRMMKARKRAKAFLGSDPKDVLNQIQRIVLRLQTRFDTIYRDLRKTLENEGVFIINERELTNSQKDFISGYFDNDVRQLLFPVMIDEIKKMPSLKDQSIYLAVRMSLNCDPNSYRHAIIEVPTENAPRFVALPGDGKRASIILLDDVVRFGLPRIFAMFDCSEFEAYTIKITRDAELDIEDDITTSFYEQISKSLKKRKRGAPVRFIYDTAIPGDFLKLLSKKSNLTSTDTLIPGGRYHNFKDFMGFPSVGAKTLKYKSLPPLPHRDISVDASIFPVIREKDVLLHYPFHSFRYMIDLLREASIDPRVDSIKITVYRVAKSSKIMNALINAARNGKNVIVVLELQARFDEEANIYWTTRLREEGIKIIHGVPDLKVHCKLCLITRREGRKKMLYASIGTGNFNESTARIYSDHSLFTSDRRLTREVERIFEFFSHNYKMRRYTHLLVAPFHLRAKLLRLIQKEMENAGSGKDAYIILKVNSLMDKVMIDRLYAASQAGVKIKMIVRGICSLVPGVPGLSDNIEVISILDRFLEHSRIYVFCNDGDELCYISSADWMTRNLDRRVEVACPIYDPEIRRELRDVLDIQLSDNKKARILAQNQENRYRSGKNGASGIRSQYKTYEYIQKHHLSGDSAE